MLSRSEKHGSRVVEQSKHSLSQRCFQCPCTLQTNYRCGAELWCYQAKYSRYVCGQNSYYVLFAAHVGGHGSTLSSADALLPHLCLSLVVFVVLQM